MKKFSFWLWLTVVFQLLTGAIHSISLFVEQAPKNDTEKQMDDIMKHYHIDAGMGFNPTFQHLFTALSSCFTLVYFLGGLLNLYLYKKKIPMDVMKGVMGINLVIFGVSFVLMSFFTFLPPIVCTGLVFASCLGAWFTAKEK